MKTRSRKPLLLKSNEQYCLDFGQKNYQPIKCTICGMLYTKGEETDEKQHAKYHAEFDNGVKWNVKVERVKKYLNDKSRIVEILATDPRPTLDCVNRLIKMSYNDMSAGEDVCKLIENPITTRFYIYVNSTNNAIGYICVEKITEAYVLIDYESSRLESEPSEAFCGILYLWVHPSHRRQGIATWLLDVARANIQQSRIVSRSRVAVCDPTSQAIPFLNKYLKLLRPIKVYQK